MQAARSGPHGLPQPQRPGFGQQPRRFPHHGAFGFKKVGKILFEAVRMLGVSDIGVPLPKSMLYEGENPFEVL